jgi:hypothetical protein
MIKPFDTISFEVKIGNGCSRILSCDQKDVIKKQWYQSKRPWLRTSMAHWIQPRIVAQLSGWLSTIADIIFPDSLYVPGNCLRLLSQQHLPQGLKNNKKEETATRCTTSAQRMVLERDNLNNRKTMPISKESSIVGIMFSYEGFNKYYAYAAQTDVDYQ